MSTPRTVSLQEKFDLFTEHWSPRIVGELNGQQVKLVKISGEFVWHAHEHEDELFLVTRGTLRMRFRTHEVLVGVGEFIIVPRGVEHQPVADTGEVWMLLFEPASTVNTGTAGGERTVTELERL
ncbi:cupin domain-containing protein [Deinococcus aestuarii]|uniref:cupin domain-containing protein n=1 Tax=Deinococcus aestuarii TaxID=2774531 RepID=UPI001C0B90A5|nr:cupin domain-containing protein [Deinococcus aestuarii]